MFTYLLRSLLFTIHLVFSPFSLSYLHPCKHTIRTNQLFPSGDSSNVHSVLPWFSLVITLLDPLPRRVHLRCGYIRKTPLCLNQYELPVCLSVPVTLSYCFIVSLYLTLISLSIPGQCIQECPSSSRTKQKDLLYPSQASKDLYLPILE